MILLKDYRKQFGSHLVIDVPALQLPAGIYWLKGENGSGKSTLLKSVAGLIPFRGTIAVYGLEISKQRTEYKTAVNYAEAEPLYPGFLSGSDLITFYRQTKKGTGTTINALIAAFGLDTYLHNKIETYSSGMLKKLSLALAFIGQPKLILLDEPLVTLDVNAVAVLQQLIQEHYGMGISFLITSHQPITIPGLSPSTLLLKDKQLSLI